MPAQAIFQIDMALGYLAWALCLGAYVWPRLRAMERTQAQRAIATLHSFRFFGLVFLLPGFVGTNLPHTFAQTAAFGDLATGALALLALLSVRVRFLFWPLVWAFNLVGLADLVTDTALAVELDLPSAAGELGAGFVIPILYVPLLLWTHLLALWLLLRPAQTSVRSANAVTPLVAAK